jgi:hypothetical protein
MINPLKRLNGAQKQPILAGAVAEKQATDYLELLHPKSIASTQTASQARRTCRTAANDSRVQ